MNETERSVIPAADSSRRQTVDRLVQSRVEQGLPVTVEDPVALRKVATLLAARRHEAAS